MLASVNVIRICRDELAQLKKRFPTELQDDVDRVESVPILRNIAVVNNFAPMFMFIAVWGALLANQLLSLGFF